MQFKYPRFSIRTLLIVMAVIGVACWFGARIIHRKIIANRPIVWKAITKETYQELDKADRAMVIWGADWDPLTTVKYQSMYANRPELRLAAYDLGCTCFTIDLTDEKLLEDYFKRFPSVSSAQGTPLFLERGKEIQVQLPNAYGSYTRILLEWDAKP